MMDDTINRQSTIDTIHKTICGFFDVAEDDSEEPISEKDKLLLEVNKAICNGIKELPSSQPQDIARDIATIIENEQDMRVVLKNAEHTETHACDYEHTETHDLISRQAAIDALGDKPLAWTDGLYELGLQNQWQSDVDALKDLPPVQPESKREWYMKGYRDAQEKWWRPVSILPDETEVIISHRGSVWEDFATFDDDGQHILMGSGVDADSIDAWMPLPEAYREKKSHEQSNH